MLQKPTWILNKWKKKKEKDKNDRQGIFWIICGHVCVYLIEISAIIIYSRLNDFKSSIIS